jgi:hypothetical protein
VCDNSKKSDAKKVKTMSIFLCRQCIWHILNNITGPFTRHEGQEYILERIALHPELCVRCCMVIVKKPEASKLKK